MSWMPTGAFGSVGHDYMIRPHPQSKATSPSRSRFAPADPGRATIR
ncbi:MAG: hypothetical protein AVDCRST_MAG43-1498 [uncultured Thermomicrobiales bacterium]|uniref:Uncharacterized protein n=1 Tax=uncultured Thermomicrobiales bacterium TaxID=1645740 RepID=A0A6J4UNW6_9BACT|nr:MAG: hypothetical protein AVDCRST_MAG43-1498 [uncultured Thermomicrobiales bacterium]